MRNEELRKFFAEQKTVIIIFETQRLQQRESTEAGSCINKAE